MITDRRDQAPARAYAMGEGERAKERRGRVGKEENTAAVVLWADGYITVNGVGYSTRSCRLLTVPFPFLPFFLS